MTVNDIIEVVDLSNLGYIYDQNDDLLWRYDYKEESCLWDMPLMMVLISCRSNEVTELFPEDNTIAIRIINND